MPYRIALIPGDGIGLEVVPEAVRVLKELAGRYQFGVEFAEFPYSCNYFLQHGVMMPADGIVQLRPFDAILLGTMGAPGVPDHVSLWGLLIPIRRRFDQYVHVRPVRRLPGIASPLAGCTAKEIDFVVIHDTEGEHSRADGRPHPDTERDAVVQESIFTRVGVDRVQRYAFELARTRARKQVTSATKSNGIIRSMPFWDRRFWAIAAEYPDIKTVQFHIDILTKHFVEHPEWFDVVVASNLIGGILADLGPTACAGGIGIAPSANLNPEKRYPSMFEPVHGSAPDIAGQGIANPIATLWSVVLMLDFLGEAAAAAALMAAIEAVTGAGEVLTRDLGGRAGTSEFTDAVLKHIR
jgi:tartrate dehydrogenase/decarboxylase/D-malate dehydrogenase